VEIYRTTTASLLEFAVVVFRVLGVQRTVVVLFTQGELSITGTVDFPLY